MYPLHHDIALTAEKKQIVRDYVQRVDFHLPGATSRDFEVADVARYVGWAIMPEDLDSYVVGLQCTAPGMESYRTFIRMSHGQLTGQKKPKLLPVNEPVTGFDALTMQRWRDTPTGPSRTGVDSYADDPGVPGADLDLTMLDDTLADIRDFHLTGTTIGGLEILDLKVYWGTLLAGRYPRLKHFAEQGALTDEQTARLRRFDDAARSMSDILSSLGLATIDQVRTVPGQASAGSTVSS